MGYSLFLVGIGLAFLHSIYWDHVQPSNQRARIKRLRAQTPPAAEPSRTPGKVWTKAETAEPSDQKTPFHLIDPWIN